MMNAKEYLGQAYRLDQSITSKLQQVEGLRSLAERVTAAYGGEVVSHSRNLTSLQDVIARLMEAEEELNQEIDKLVGLKIEIADAISELRNENYRLILEKRYLCYLRWDQIATDMNISRRWAITLHNRAMSAVGKVLLRKGVIRTKNSAS